MGFVLRIHERVGFLRKLPDHELLMQLKFWIDELIKYDKRLTEDAYSQNAMFNWQHYEALVTKILKVVRKREKVGNAEIVENAEAILRKQEVYKYEF